MRTKKLQKKHATPVFDRLKKIKPPEGCTPDQWEQYLERIKSTEEAGIVNPEFTVEKPWIKKCCTRGGGIKFK